MMNVTAKNLLKFGWLIFLAKTQKKKKQHTIINFAGKLTTQERKKCDTLLARALYACVAPFSMVENTHWKSIFYAI